MNKKSDTQRLKEAAEYASQLARKCEDYNSRLANRSALAVKIQKDLSAKGRTLNHGFIRS